MLDKYYINREFIKSRGKPIRYKERTLHMWDQLPLPFIRTRIKYKTLSTDSEWSQGISVRAEGKIVFGKIISNRKWLDFWDDQHPWEGEFECHSKEQILQVKNVWDTGNGCIESWHNGAAMWIEEIPNGRRYHCNDGHFDDDFDELVFELTILGPVEKRKSN